MKFNRNHYLTVLEMNRLTQQIIRTYEKITEVRTLLGGIQDDNLDADVYKFKSKLSTTNAPHKRLQLEFILEDKERLLNNLLESLTQLGEFIHNQEVYDSIKDINENIDENRGVNSVNDNKEE